MSVAILAPVLLDIGLPILKRVLADRLPEGLARDVAGEAVSQIGKRLGIENPTPEAIRDAYVKDPATVTAAAHEVEQTFGPEWLEAMLAAERARAEIFAREDAKSFFHNGWRPALSWLTIWGWSWNMTILPVVNAAAKSNLPLVPWEHLLGLTGIWLAIYGGGHTIKSVMGAKK